MTPRKVRGPRTDGSQARLGTTATPGPGRPRPISGLREAQSLLSACNGPEARGPRPRDARALDGLGEGGAAERASPACLRGPADAK